MQSCVLWLCLAAAVICAQHQATHAAAAVHQWTCMQQITHGVPSFHALSSKTLCQRFRHMAFIHTPTKAVTAVTALMPWLNSMYGCQHPQFLLQHFCHEQCALVCQEGLPASCQHLSSASLALCGLLSRSAVQHLTSPACLAAGHRQLRPSSGHQKLSPVMHTRKTCCQHSWQRQLVLSADDDS